MKSSPQNQLHIEQGGFLQMKDVNSLSHTSWNCKYHIVFAPKYRRRVFYGQKRREIGAILRQLCEWKNVEIIEAEVCPDHVHMLVAIPPKISVASFVGFLKGKSSLLIYQKWANMKFKYRNREFWCRGYYVDTVTYFYGRYLLVCQTSVALLLLKIGKILVGRLPVERGGKIACLFVLQKL